MLVESPLREPRKILGDPRAVRMEDVRSIRVNEDAVGIMNVVCVAADMRPLVDDHNVEAMARKALGNHRAREARTHDEDVGPHRDSPSATCRCGSIPCFARTAAAQTSNAFVYAGRSA